MEALPRRLSRGEDDLATVAASICFHARRVVGCRRVVPPMRIHYLSCMQPLFKLHATTI